MITRRLASLFQGVVGASLLLLVLGPFAALAAETAFQVRLVWGTNGEKPKNEPLKDVDAKLKEKLKGVFKWQNYYEVSQKTLSVSKDATSPKLKLSDKCEIQLQDLGSSRIEVRLFGEGKPVVKRTQTVVPGEMIILAGDSKGDTAWFVVLVPPK